MDHYTKLASHYDQYYRYSNNYINYFTNKIIEELQIGSGESVVELGAGTCIFAEEILKRIPYIEMVCVDNSKHMLDGSDHGFIKLVCQDAVAFSKENIAYHRIYMKEFIHHLPKASRIALFQGIYKQLNKTGSLLILMEPGRLNYPLFDEALRRFEDNQPSRSAIMEELEEAGFKTTFNVLSYPINLSKKKYIEMVRNRYMSVLETFTERELAEGISAICDTQKTEELEFLESFYSIKGTKE